MTTNPMGMIEAVARADALRLGLKRYFTGQPCRNGHISERSTANRDCIRCALERQARDPRKPERTRASAERTRGARAERQRARYHADIKRSREYNRNHRLSNLEAYSERDVKQREKHAERIAAYVKRRWETNRDAMVAARKRWEAKNGHIVAARVARRRAAEAKATPKWADKDKIAAVYAEAARLTRETGIPHHVDHFYPLRGKTCCGLHVHENLRAIPASENCRKKNRMPAIDAALSEPTP